MPTQTTTNDELDAVKKDLSALRADLEALVKSASAGAADRGKETLDNVRAKGQQGAEALGKQIEERPLTSIAGAFGAGLLIGILARR